MAEPDPAPVEHLHDALLTWFATHQRPLPWRGASATPWGVLVSEVMLQQTPVVRVEPVWRDWLERWPTPAHLTGASPADVVRAWGRLGYPRRALRLREAASVVVERHDGAVPRRLDDLLALPGVGPYTAAAVAAFAFGERAVVLDTNVRRVLARVLGGEAGPPPHLRKDEVMRAEAILPRAAGVAAAWSVAVMELGALVCTARAPACASCPVAAPCSWRAAGLPPAAAPSRRAQTWHGTDRQARGRLLGLLREADDGVPAHPRDLARAWPEPDQRERALTSLVADGLVEIAPGGRYRLPSA